MSKGPNKPPLALQKDASVQAADWFVAAILVEGTVRDSLDTVIGHLSRKKDFLTEVKERICTEDGNIDRITILGRHVKELENTLRFRLGMLTPERSAAWFREAPKRDIGPFNASMLLAPVFSPYKVDQTLTVKNAVYELWTSAKEGPLPFAEQEQSLWSILLSLRAKLEAVATLGPKFRGLRLDQLPDELPTDLESRSLRAFLLNVRNEFRVVRDRLNVCFDQLWSASDKFWAAQLAQVEKQKQAQKKQAQTGTDEPRAQRAGGRSQTHKVDFGLGFADVEALRFMGFQQKPTKDILRTRYLELAKKMHPDRTGGNEESFKLLNKAYNRLLDIV